MQRLEKANIKLKINKCQFFTEKVKFLGHEISTEGMKMCERRVKSIEKMPCPENKKQLQSFLGATNYYRMFVKKFAKIAAPLYQLLKKDVKYVWGRSRQRQLTH